MLLALSLENSQIFLGIFDGEKQLCDAQFATDREKSADEYAILIQGILAMHHVDRRDITRGIIASVVRPLNAVISQAVEKLSGITPLFLGPGVKSGVNIKTDIPSQVGADIVANAVGALSLQKAPLVVVSFGTATTLAGLNSAGELTGVLIYPGIRASLDALSTQAAELPSIAPDKPKSVLGKNTIDSMVGGIIYGNAAMVDGLLDRIASEWNTKSLTVITTGHLAKAVIPYCQSGHQISYEPNLTLIGLQKIDQLNDRSHT
ncbi:MAG: type III pantothenate kinase [Eubacteriales bacterium]|nr:type III pantothenate kinase [Eubacteriales bacterium]